MLLNLINDTLDFSKIDAGKLALETNSFELHALINTILNMLGHKAETKGIHLTSRLKNNVPAIIKGDSGRLRQVLVNLIEDARCRP